MNALANQCDLRLLPVGTVLRVSHGLYDHVGLLSDRVIQGERCVLSLSAAADGLVEEPYSAFAAGRQVFSDGYFGRLPPEVVLQRARSKAGQVYLWTVFNCEHLVRYAHGVRVESPQLQRWMLFAGGCAGLFAVLTRA
jgi:hypothetical protein